MPKTILIVDDNASVRDVLKDVLEGKGYSVESVGDGLEALVCVREKTIELIVLDLIMPHRSGMEIFTAIKCLQPSTKIIIYTGFQRYENSIYAQKADKLILKGGDPGELLEAIEETLR